MSHDASNSLQRPEQETQISDDSKERTRNTERSAGGTEDAGVVSSPGVQKRSKSPRRRSSHGHEGEGEGRDRDVASRHSRSHRDSRRNTSRSRSRERRSRHRSRSRKSSHRSRSKDRKSSHRSRSRDRKSSHRSRSRDRKSSHRSRSRDRKSSHRSRSRDRKSSHRSRSRDRKSRHRSRSRDRGSRHRESGSRRRDRRSRRERSRSSSSGSSSGTDSSDSEAGKSRRKRSRKGVKKADATQNNMWKELFSGRVGTMPAAAAAALQQAGGLSSAGTAAQSAETPAVSTVSTAAATAAAAALAATGSVPAPAVAAPPSEPVLTDEERQGRTLVVRGLAKDADLEEFKVFLTALLGVTGVAAAGEPLSKCISKVAVVDLRPELARAKALAIAARVAVGGPIEPPVPHNSTKLLEGAAAPEEEEERVELLFRSAEERNGARHLNGVPFHGAEIELSPHPDAAQADLPRLTAHQVSKLVQLGAKVGRLPGGEDPSTREGTIKLGRQLAAITVRGEGRSWPSQLPSTTIAVLDIPGQFSEDDVKLLVSPFGTVAVMEVSAPDEAGLKVAMVMFETDSAAANACQGLHNTPIGADHLIVRRAAQLGNSSIARLPLFMELAREALYASWPVDERPSKCVVLDKMITVEEARDAAEVADIAAELREELSTVGTVEDIRIPSPRDGETDEAAQARGVGLILVRMQDVTGAARVTVKMAGRMFDGRELKCTMYPELLWDMEVAARDLEPALAKARAEHAEKLAKKAEEEAARKAAEEAAARAAEEEARKRAAEMADDMD